MTQSSTDLDDLLETLRTSTIVEVYRGKLPGATGARKVILESGHEGIFKAGNAPHQQSERMVRYEVAAFEIARMVGVPDLVPPTVLRTLPDPDGKDVECSLQIFIIGEDCHDVAVLTDEDVALAAAFDVVTRQLDRAKRNWLVAWDGHGIPHPVLYDNGCAFDYDTKGAEGDYIDLTDPRSVFIDEAQRRDLQLPLDRFAVLGEQANRALLQHYLSDEAISQLLARTGMSGAT